MIDDLVSVAISLAIYAPCMYDYHKYAMEKEAEKKLDYYLRESL